jgi:uncharacterized protein
VENDVVGVSDLVRKDVDVIIIGAGPAGIFAAMELSKVAPRLSLLIVEKGPDISQRSCPMLSKKGQKCAHCSPCLVLCGWGGAGAFSDGKLTLTSEFGGFLPEYMEKPELDSLIRYVDAEYIRFGAPGQVYGTDKEKVRDLTRIAARAGLRLLPGKIRHLGTENCPPILSGMRDSLAGKVEILYRSPVARILAEGGQVTGIELASGEKIRSKYVIAAPGREGAEWFRNEAARLGLKLANNPVDIGVRVEVPAVIAEDIAKDVYEPKLIYYSKSFDDPVRTFCFNPNGEVVMENNAGLITVNGHSYVDKRTDNTNFALLVSKTFTEPFHEPIAYGKYIASLANMLGGGIIVQRLGDLTSGRRSTEKRLQKAMVEPTLKEATPGDLSLVLPYRHLIDILEMLQTLDLIIPGVNSKHTLLYGVEVKFYSSRPEVDHDLETRTRNLYAIGDGAGVTRSLAQASVSGVMAARSIARKETR